MILSYFTKHRHKVLSFNSKAIKESIGSLSSLRLFYYCGIILTYKVGASTFDIDGIRVYLSATIVLKPESHKFIRREYVNKLEVIA